MLQSLTVPAREGSYRLNFWTSVSIPLEERQVPTDEELETLISQRAVFLLEAHLREADNIQKERLQRFTRIAADLAGNEDSLTLLAMLVDEFYQKTFHAPLAQPSEKLLPLAHPGQAPAEKTEGEKRKHKRRKKNESTTEHNNQQTVVGPSRPGRHIEPAIGVRGVSELRGFRPL